MLPFDARHLPGPIRARLSNFGGNAVSVAETSNVVYLAPLSRSVLQQPFSPSCQLDDY
jgi:hypothetical protein